MWAAWVTNTATSLRPRSRSTLVRTARVIDAAMPEHEQDHRLVVRVGLRPPAREARARPRTRRRGAGDRAGGRGGRGAAAAEPALGAVVADGTGVAASRRRWCPPVAAAAGAALEVGAESLPPLLWTILVISRKPTITASTPSTAIWATGLSFRAFLTSWPRRGRPPPGRKNEGPNLPTPLGLRTLLRRWASTGEPNVAHRKSTPKPIVLAHNWSGYRTSSSLA